MANTRTESFGTGDPHGKLDYVPRGAANPNSDYGRNRSKPVASEPTQPAHHYEKPKPGRSNWEPMATPDQAQKGLSAEEIADRDAVMKQGVEAARRQLDPQVGNTAVAPIVEQPTLFENL